MNTKEDNNQWSLIRNDNGEWISEEYAEYLSQEEVSLLKENYGERISIQHGQDGSFWCYKYELKSLQKDSDANN